MEEQQKKQRRRYDKQFKENAVRLVNESGKAVTEVALDFGVDVTTLYTWKRELTANGASAFPGKGHQTAAEEELRRLQRELAIALEERDILKKALAFFSKTAR